MTPDRTELEWIYEPVTFFEALSVCRFYSQSSARLIVLYVAASKFAVSDAWSNLAKAIFKT